MKTIEERAEEYVRENLSHYGQQEVGSTVENAYIAGAESEHAELTRWNDPKEVPPEDCRIVLVKLQYAGDSGPSYTVGYWDKQWFGDFLGNTDGIIGWREIHE